MAQLDRLGTGAAVIVPLALFTQLAGTCAPEVAPGTLAALAAVESHFDTLAVHDNATHAALWPKDEVAAVNLAQKAIAAGHSVDLGLMQINSRNLGPLHLSVAEAFEPCASLRAGAALLVKDYAGGGTPAARQAALRAALSRYNTGTAHEGFANGYVAEVVSAAKRVVPEIDPGAGAAAAKLPPAAVPKDWNVFPDSPGPGHLRWQLMHRAAGTGKAPAPAQQRVMKSSVPAWNVFPRSAGPDRLAVRSPVTLTGHLASSAATASEGSDD
ncbi:MAG: lytic transglycosylase domain-containing protein [Acetobacteraceae bacterium]